jgi:phosphoglycerol transferase MdoB-like AlkP superfamily enzyme
MMLSMFLGFIAFVLGVSELFCKGRERIAKIGIVTQSALSGCHFLLNLNQKKGITV